jgi:hypothetical protein
MAFLKPSKGTMTMEQTFKGIFLADAFQRCFVVVRMGRIKCTAPPTSWVRISSTTITREGQVCVVNGTFANRRLAEPAIRPTSLMLDKPRFSQLVRLRIR